MEPKCPYCSAQLKKLPQRKTKCPDCGNYIYVRRHPETERKVLVTEDGKKAIDEMWAERNLVKWVERLDWLGVTEEYFERNRQELRLRFGGEPGEFDIIWRIYNDALLTHKDYQDKRAIYNSMAHLLNEEGRDSTEVQKHAYLCELYRMKEIPVEQVEIHGMKDTECIGCKLWDGKIMSLQSAIAMQPLPPVDCENRKINHSCICGYYMHFVE